MKNKYLNHLIEKSSDFYVLNIKIIMVNKRRLFLFFIGLMLVGAFIRIYRINSFGLYGDEKQSILIAVANTNYGGMGDLLLPPATFTPSDFWKSRGIKSWIDADIRGDISGNSLVHDMALKLFSSSVLFIFNHLYVLSPIVLPLIFVFV